MTATPIRTLALEEFTRRQTRARAVVANRRMTVREAEAHLRPWAAIATHCGADLPEAQDLLGEIMRCVQTPAGRHDAAGGISTGGPTPPQADGMTHPGLVRWLLAEEICPRSRWAPLLAAARDAAMDRLHLDESTEALASAAALHRIALALTHDVNGRHPIPAYDAARRIERARAAERIAA